MLKLNRNEDKVFIGLMILLKKTSVEIRAEMGAEMRAEIGAEMEAKIRTKIKFLILILI